MQISALVLTFNEQEVIEDCLESLNFVDEIIILDQYSTDNTAEIAKKFTQNLFKTKDRAFDKNRNKLASYAKGKWLLYLDSDERLTEEGINEIQKSIKDDKYSAFFIPRKNYVLGKQIKHGGWWPDYAPRLFKKQDFIKWVGKIHESPKFKGKEKYLKEPLIHITARNLNLMLEKTIKWAKVEADLYYRSNNPKVTIAKIIKASLSEFIYRYIFKKGFLDGVVGLIQAIFQVYHKAIIFTYLWELQTESVKKFENEKQKNSLKI